MNSEQIVNALIGALGGAGLVVALLRYIWQSERDRVLKLEGVVDEHSKTLATLRTDLALTDSKATAANTRLDRNRR